MKRELLLATESVSRVEKLINSRTKIDAFNREYSIEKQVFDYFERYLVFFDAIIFKLFYFCSETRQSILFDR